MTASADKRRLYHESKLNKTLQQEVEASALLCLYYPQYTLEESLEITSGEIDLMLKIAKREEIKRNMIALSIAGAANSKKGYVKLQRDFKKGMERLG